MLKRSKNKVLIRAALRSLYLNLKGSRSMETPPRWPLRWTPHTYTATSLPPLTPNFKQLQRLSSPAIHLRHKARRSLGAEQHKHAQIASVFPAPPMQAVPRRRDRGLNQCGFVYDSSRANFKELIPFCLCSGEAEKARPYAAAAGDCRLDKTNSCELSTSFLALQGDAGWRNMLALVGKSASWI